MKMTLDTTPPIAVPAIQCELVTEFSRLDELSCEWRQWAEKDKSTTVFQCWEWTRAYWKAYGAHVSLCCVGVHQRGRILGILPLVRRGESVEFLGTPESDYNDLLCEPGAATTVLEAALSFLIRSDYPWTCAVLEKIPAASNILRSVPYLSPALQRHLQVVYRCPSPAVVAGEDAAKVWEALIRKEQLRRYDRKVRKLGPLRFRHIETRDEAREHLDRFFQQHITRWAMQGDRSQFLQTERRTFYEALVDEFDPANQLRFAVLELDSHPIAYHFGFQHRGTLTWYKPAFDVNYWEYCPGDVLLRSLLCHARDEGLNELDFTIGDERFKYRFANHIRENYILYVERRPESLRSRLRVVARGAQHIVRQRPDLKAAIKHNIGRARGLAEELRHVARKDVFKSKVGTGLRALSHWVTSCDNVRFYAGFRQTPGPVDGVDIVPGTLERLASLSAEFGYFLSPSRLHDYRRLLKQTDQHLLIARDSSGCAFVLRLERRTTVAAPEAGPDCFLRLEEPSLVVVECWKAPVPSVREAPPVVLRALAAHVGQQFWIHHVRGSGTLGEAIHVAGMQLRFRLIRRAVLGSLRQVREAPITAANGSLNNPVKEVAHVGS